MTDISLFKKYRKAISSFKNIKDRADLLIRDFNGKRVYYAPFDYVNPNALICIVGITPGETQMENMLFEAKRLISTGLSDEEVLKQCKHVGSFSGTMRQNLTEMLDYVGFNKKFKIATCAELFTKHTQLANFTSAAKYPVFSFKEGKESNFNKSLLSFHELFSYFAPLTRDEMRCMPSAYIVPLGHNVYNYLMSVLGGTKAIKKLLPALPHPSGANNERINYFLEKKAAKDLSKKTNPSKIDAVRNAYLEALGKVL